MQYRFALISLCTALACATSWTITPARAAPQAYEILDIDANGAFDARTDGMLIMRYAFGLRGQSLVQGAVGPNATRNTSGQIETYLGTVNLDIDANGSVDALTDAQLMIRYAMGVRGQRLIKGAIGSSATRFTAADVEAYLALMASQLPGNCALSQSPQTSVNSPIVPGTAVELTAACSTGPGPIGFSWNIGVSGINKINIAPQITTTYTVTPTNSNGSSAPFSTTVYVMTAPGACSVTQTPNTANAPVAAGTTVMLAVNCTSGSAPTSCSWSGGVTSACTVNIVAPQSNTVYSVIASNAAGSAPAVNTTVNVAQNVAPSGCSVTQTPNTVSTPVAAGTTVSLSISCTTGSPPTSCSWSNGLPSNCAVDVTAPQTTTNYSVIPVNSAGSGPQLNTTINVSTAPPPLSFCTPNVDDFTDLGWPPNGQWKYQVNGLKDQRVAYRITAPLSLPYDPTKIGFIRMAETPGAAVVVRAVTVSKSACDFQTGNYLFDGIHSSDTAPSIPFTINNPNGFRLTGAAFNLMPGEPVYLNVWNHGPNGSTCPYTNCDMFIDFKY